MNHKKSNSNMNREIHAISHDLGRLSHDARSLLAATADVAGGKMTEARERLARALEHHRETFGRVRDLAAARTRAAGKIVRRHPYQVLGVGVGIATLLGYIIIRRWSQNHD